MCNFFIWSNFLRNVHLVFNCEVQVHFLCALFHLVPCFEECSLGGDKCFPSVVSS
jgi:hypothetical protein